MVESSHKSDFFFSPKRPIVLHACATVSELPSNISTMVQIDARELVMRQLQGGRYELFLLKLVMKGHLSEEAH